MGFIICESDPALFYKHTPEGRIFILTYVDDFLVVAPLDQQVKEVLTSLENHFDIKDLGFPQKFTGIQVHRMGGDDVPYSVILYQESHIQELLEAHNLQNCHPSRVPISSNDPISKLDPRILTAQDQARYSSIVGSLLYIACCTRPDISFAVNVLTRHLHEPKEVHMKLATQVCKYLSGTKRFGLHYTHSDQSPLEGFADADYATCKDTRRSTTGYVFKLAGAAISYQCRRQPTVATSTQEAELQATGAAAREAMWLRKVQRDLGVPQNVINIREDNNAALLAVMNPVLTDASKHIEVIHFYARDQVQRDMLSFTRIDSDANTADIFTKVLQRSTFETHRCGLGIKEVPTRN